MSHGFGVLRVAACVVLAVPVFGQQAATERRSVDSAGNEGIYGSWSPSISSDGRCAAFSSAAPNLVANDTNGARDIFVHDRQTGQTVRTSVDSAGNQGSFSSFDPSISADGCCVAFLSSADNLVPGDSNQLPDVFVHDLQTAQTTRVNVDSAGLEANNQSSDPSISADGRCVAFLSSADNLVPGDSNQLPDIFVHDLQTAQTTRVNVDSGGLEANSYSSWPSISADGRWVAFDSGASNLVPGDTNGSYDVFVHDRQTGQTSRASVDSAGTQGNDQSRFASLSADGRFVAFGSYATNLVPGDTNGIYDVFVHDRQTGLTSRVSVSSSGIQANQSNDAPSIAGGGRHVAFESFATNLVPNDTNGDWDVFVHDRLTGQTVRASVHSNGNQGNDNSLNPAISLDGRHVAFESRATNLVPDDKNGAWDVFVHDRGAGLVTSYCIAKINSQGCASAMIWAGFPSATSPSAFTLGAMEVLNQKSGLLFYGYGLESAPFQGGFLCVSSPTRRTPVQNSGGNVGLADCSGSFLYDMNARIQSGVDPGLAAGADVFAQYWSRDPASLSMTHLTDAVSFRILP